jgi:hypothetical protein
MYLNTFWKETGRQNISEWIIAIIPSVESAVNLFVDEISIYECRSEVF